MPRNLSATVPSNNLSDDLAFLKYGYVLLCFVVTLLAVFSARKFLTWQGEKLVHLALRFVAGVCLGTAMLDLLSMSNDVFSTFFKFSYPLAFVLLCTGYVSAMLVDCLLAARVRRVGQKCFNIVKPNAIDKIMLSLVEDFHPSKCCDATLPVGTSKSSIKECGGIGNIRDQILYRATVLGDYIVLYLTFGLLSILGGMYMRGANTETMAWRTFLKATLLNMTYAISMVVTFQSSAQSLPFFFVILFTMITPYSFIMDLVLSKIEFKSGPGDELSHMLPPRADSSFFSDACFLGIYLGFFSGVLVHLSIHHLLANRYQLKMSVSKIRLGDIMMMGSGIAAIALLKAWGM